MLQSTCSMLAADPHCRRLSTHLLSLAKVQFYLQIKNLKRWKKVQNTHTLSKQNSWIWSTKSWAKWEIVHSYKKLPAIFFQKRFEFSARYTLYTKLAKCFMNSMSKCAVVVGKSCLRRTSWFDCCCAHHDCYCSWLLVVGVYVWVCIVVLQTR